MIIRRAQQEDADKLSPLVAQFRVELKGLKGIKSTPKLAQAKDEILEYLEAKYPIYIAESENKELVGYLVLRVDQGVVWAESIFVKPDCRRKGIAVQLYQKAEQLVGELGGDTVYNWVHPNNDQIINLLAKMDYNVLNLIEIRKAYPDEIATQIIRVGNHEYKY